MTEHPLAETLRLHLRRWRGSWISKLTPELRDALQALPEPDLRRAATVLLHGPPTCDKQKLDRIADGWKFCASNGRCPCFMQHFHQQSEATNMAKRGVKNAAQAAEVQQKIQQTCLERYGVAATGALESRRQKAEATNFTKYGVANVFASPQIKQQIKDTNRSKYGVEHIASLPEHQDKMRQSVRAIWGVDNAAQHPDVVAKIKHTNLDRYGGPAPASSSEVQRKMRQTMEERFGGHASHFHIAPHHRIKDEEDFRRRFTGRRANAIAEETGYHPAMIHRYASMWNVALDYTGGSHRDAENAFADCLTAEGLVFERNAKILLSEGSLDRRRVKHIDFYFSDQRFGVEFCGAYWHSDACGKQRDYHAAKLAAALRQNIDLIQVFEDEWIEHGDAVLATIRHKLGRTTTKLHARKCTVRPVAHPAATEFYDLRHVYGGVAASVHLGLYHDDTLVACMSFTQRKPAAWDLVRFATSGSVVGGASRLLAAFERQFAWDTITSFVDLRWSKGGLYETLGFVVDQQLAPDYAYVIGNHRVHKFNLRKTSRRFGKYAGSGLTEREMATLEGIPRVYDAGKLRVVKRRTI